MAGVGDEPPHPGRSESIAMRQRTITLVQQAISSPDDPDLVIRHIPLTDSPICGRHVRHGGDLGGGRGDQQRRAHIPTTHTVSCGTTSGPKQARDVVGDGALETSWSGLADTTKKSIGASGAAVNPVGAWLPDYGGPSTHTSALRSRG